MFAGPALIQVAGAAETSAGLCVTICNHWSYIGIGWQLGIESCVLSVMDAMEMADRPPHAKTCLNLDARAYEVMAEKFPAVTERLKRYLADGKVELIGGTYGQPMGTTISGESNVRQIVVGRETIRKALGYEMVTFLEEEEFTHPQVPQMAAGAGFRYASLAQLDTWGRAGIPVLEFNAIRWKGVDGTTIPCVPRNPLFGYAPDLKQLVASPAFKKLQGMGKPLLFTWEEFGWESPEQPAYLTTPARYKALADQHPAEFVTLKEYLDKYGSAPKETVFLPMDAWNKSLTWGLGGDQVRVLDRKVEGLLLAAELFDAVVSLLGGKSQVDVLEKAWKNLLASQSHDVGLCEYSRWQGDRMAPFERLEDHHNFTWGAIGYNHLDAAQRQGQAALDAAADALVRRIDSQTKKQADRAVTVMNPHAWKRSDVAIARLSEPLTPPAQSVLIKDRAGRVVPSQILKADAGRGGPQAALEVAFLAKNVPSAGYDTYYIEFSPNESAAVPTGLRIDEAKATMENDLLRVTLDTATGAVASLVHKPSGRETIDGKQAAFPHFTGRPNPNLSLKPKPPAFYDSATSKGQVDWIAQSPLLATLRAQHRWPYLTYETRVTLAAAMPYVEVVTRLLVLVPPHSDAVPPDIKEGYWASFAPAFEPITIVRDYPFGVEATKKPAFHALTFVDLVGTDVGLLVLHPGTQWFRREEKGQFSNLLMREWESHFSREYGWPLYAEYHHRLWPHAGDMTNADRLRAAAALSRPLICRTARAHPGDLPPSKSFLALAPANVQLASWRKKSGPGYELRVVENQGQPANAIVDLALPIKGAIATDLLGRKTADVARTDSRLTFPIQPWKIRTLEVT